MRESIHFLRAKPNRTLGLVWSTFEDTGVKDNLVGSHLKSVSVQSCKPNTSFSKSTTRVNIYFQYLIYFCNFLISTLLLKQISYVHLCNSFSIPLIYYYWIVIMSESPAKKQKMTSSLEQLKKYTMVVADTGDFEGLCSLLHELSDLHSSFNFFILQKFEKVNAYSKEVRLIDSFLQILTLAHLLPSMSYPS